jgi:uncharacterized protein (TIGR02118 family)
MIKVIALLKRKPEMTHEQFTRRWLDEHINMSSKMPGLRGYRVNIATPYQPEGTEEPIYDGTAELWWNSIDDMEAAFASDIGVAAGVDADLFADVRIHIYTDEYIVVPGPEKAAARKGAAKRVKDKKNAGKLAAAGRKKTNRAR